MQSLALLGAERLHEDEWFTATGPDSWQGALHGLYDDTAALERPHELVGAVFATEREADIVEALARVLERTRGPSGTWNDSEPIREYAEWPAACALARSALAEMVINWRVPLSRIWDSGM